MSEEVNFSEIITYLLNEADLEDIKPVKKPFSKIEGNEEEIFNISQPGVYLFEGSVNGEPNEVLYIGKTDKRNIFLGKRIEQQYSDTDTSKSTLRKNAEDDGFTVYINSEVYREEATRNNYENTVFIESVTVWLFENNNEGFAARDVLEVLLIAKYKPIFNIEFMYLRRDERDAINDDHMLEQATNQTALGNEEKRGMTIKNIQQ
ncbi:hypothetical protein ACFPA1_08840 [Neobacillus sp. GCM10023253]|uniref:hypothetical protein n=1 Tax=Neobacillus sp. GCM10023253 TaxID=3252644 RepID=UPI003609FC1E